MRINYKAGTSGKIYVAVVLLLMYAPVFLLVAYSFNNSRTVVWQGFTLDWYTELFADKEIGKALRNSLTVMALSCTGALIIGTLGAVGVTRSTFRTKNALETVSTIPLLIPEIILGMAYLVTFSLMRIPFGMAAMVLAHITFCIPYVYINVKSRLAGMNPAIFEAARDLGASPLRELSDVTLPLIAPSIFSGVMISAAMSLDDVVISFFVTGPTANTLPLYIYSMLKRGVTPKINALCSIMLAIVLACVTGITLARAIRTRRARRLSTAQVTAE